MKVSVKYKRKKYYNGGDSNQYTPLNTLSQQALSNYGYPNVGGIGGAGGAEGLSAGAYGGIGLAGGSAFGVIGDTVMNNSYNSTGVNNNQYILGSTLKEAGKWGATGASIGTQIAPGIGTAIGAAVGTVGGGIEGFFKGKKQAKQIDEQAAAQKEAEAQEAARIADQKAAQQKALDDFNYNQQQVYNKSALQANQSLVNSTGSIMANGGKIHIKPSHKGRFTEYLKRTGKTLEEALHSDNSHVRQMANFARNAKKWKHGDGGELGMGEDYFGLHKEQPIEPEEGEQIASDMQMVEGKRHEDGGTELKETKTKMPVGEAEKGEVIKGTEIYSDRLGIKGKTYAEFAEKLGKLKAKYEKAYISASNFREKNSAQRNLQNVERQLKSVYNHQEMSKRLGEERNIKVGYNENQEQYADGGNPMDIVASVAPFIDNAYNAYAINQLQNTPIPLPVKRTYTPLTYGNLSAMPMKTTYDVSNNIAQNNADYKAAVQNLDNNTASSQVGRAYKLAALGKMLQGQNSIYQNKENIETQLANNANLNNQQVANQNVLNKQQIDNQNAGLATQMQNINAGLTDQYNQDKYLKDYAISRDKSQNVADLSYGLGSVSGAYNNRTSDENKVWLDIQRDKTGSSIDNYIGTDSFDRMMANKQKRQKARELIVDPQVLKQFNEYYGED